MEPLVVAPSQVGGHMVLFGHRRREAAIAAELATVPSIVRADYIAKTPSRWRTCWLKTCTGPT